MHPLTAAELKLLLERGLGALPDRNAAEVVEALALEVSERRLAEGELLRDALEALREAEHAFTELEAWCGDGMITGHRAKVLNMMANAPAVVDVFLTRAAEAGIGEG